MAEILGYCKEHKTWSDGYPFLCDCFCGLGYGGNPDNIVKKLRYDSETKKLKNG